MRRWAFLEEDFQTDTMNQKEKNLSQNSSEFRKLCDKLEILAVLYGHS
jgi:hypothetical protein